MTLTQTNLRTEILVNTSPISPPTSQYSFTNGGERVMRCAIYARVSTEYDSQKTSIDNQIDMFRNYAI
ncbi:putative site-specific integrase-resolvase [Neobacillus niacini]|nr:putative site-specific integrase-resolvase [Neobacillus niacini]